MKTYIVYVDGEEQKDMIKAGGHNAAEKKAQRLYGPSNEKINNFIRVNPFMDRERVIKLLTSNISVAYTEV